MPGEKPNAYVTFAGLEGKMIKKVKKLRRVIPILVAMLTLMSIMAPMALAYEAIDMDKPVTLAVEFTSGTKVSGMEFRAYKIATVDENAKFEFTENVAAYGVAMPNDQGGYRALAETLSGYFARDKVAPDYRGTTDEKGLCNFGQVEKGLYLILADRYKFEGDKMTYIVSPSLVAVPNLDEKDAWNYDVVVSPKYTSIPPLPDTPGETVDINVIKVWTGEANKEKRPTFIYAELICDGQVIDTVTLNAGNNWRHTWKELDATKTYNITEKEVPSGYTVTITRDGNTYTMNNYSGDVPPKTPPSTPRLPNTGQLWWPVPILAGVGLAFIIAGKLRKRAA